MSKITVRQTLMIARSKNFSEYANGEFDYNDNGNQEDRMYSDTNADIILVNLLSKFSDREKIVFVYEILRQSGYGITVQECAKTLSISKQWYFKILKDVRSKAKKTLLSNNK